MKSKIALIAYDFPHLRTREFIIALNVFNYKIDVIIAAPWKKLNIPKTTIRTKVKREEIFHPKDIAKLFNIDYISIPHEDKKATDIIKERKIDIGIISGARILPKEFIKAFGYGIINIHPGLIPYNRGLDSMKWAIYMDIPQGLTAHLIDERVDAGRIIHQEILPVYKDDTLFDISERIHEQQFKILKKVLDFLVKKKPNINELKMVKGGFLHSVMPPEKEEIMLKKFNKYKRNYKKIVKDFVTKNPLTTLQEVEDEV